MSIYQNLKMAEDFGLERSWAITKRSQYLTSRLMALDRGLEELPGHMYESELSQENLYYFSCCAVDLVKEKLSVLSELDIIKKMVKNPREEITDDMIQRARESRPDTLFELVRGKVRCFNHQDNRPSMYYGHRTNKMVCPVCNKTWDAISVLMERDGYSFKDAVLFLSSH